LPLGYRPGHPDHRLCRPPARKPAPGFDGDLGFPDVFEKGDLVVEAAPAAALEELGEIVEPLLGKQPPASEDVSVARRVLR